MITFVLIILGAQARPATPPEVEYDNIMPPPAATLPTRPPKPSATVSDPYNLAGLYVLYYNIAQWIEAI